MYTYAYSYHRKKLMQNNVILIFIRIVTYLSCCQNAIAAICYLFYDYLLFYLL